MAIHQDVYGEALSDFFANGKLDTPLYLHSSYGDVDEMPIEVFFREEEDFPELEHIALALCDGRVLDVGAGVGSHALYLQERGFEVETLEISDSACQIMAQRGVRHIVQDDFFHLKKEGKYDTLLFLMNGIGISGSVEGFRQLLRRSKRLLSEKGQLLFDSSDIAYLYEEYETPKPDHYWGEIQFQYEYKRNKGELFSWLYIDQQELIRIAHEENWVVQILFEDENDQYLVRMEPRKFNED